MNAALERYKKELAELNLEIGNLRKRASLYDDQINDPALTRCQQENTSLRDKNAKLKDEIKALKKQ